MTIKSTIYYCALFIQEHKIILIEEIKFNRPFPSSLVPLFQGEYKCETVLMKMTLICMKMKLHAELIFIWEVSHLNSFCNRGTRKLGNGLFAWYYRIPLYPWGIPIPSVRGMDTFWNCTTENKTNQTRSNFPRKSQLLSDSVTDLTKRNPALRSKNQLQLLKDD